MAFEIAAEEAASMEVEDDRQAVVERWPVLARSEAAGQQEIFNCREARGFPCQGSGAAHHGPSGGDIERGARRKRSLRAPATRRLQDRAALALPESCAKISR